ncbi:hypothetical protein BD413DRAFT_642322 [Trametes elegans]|nr:hypothetical protein BD413DRAFT_642322 [Trametes elegans]
MSSTADAETAEIIAYYESIFLNTCCPIAVLAFLTYEYFITLDREVTLFWRRSRTGASVLFLTNRYLPLLVNVLNISSLGRMSDAIPASSCDAYVKALQTIQLMQYLPWAAFSSLRTFALAGGDWAIATVVFLLSMVPFGINLSQYHWLVVGNDPDLGCTKMSTITLDVARRYVTHIRLDVTSECNLMDTRVRSNDRISNVFNCIGRDCPARIVMKGRPSFIRMLVRDGTVYFSILLLLNALHLIFTMLSITADPLSPVSYFTTFTEPITAVLVSRFLIDLQQVNQYYQRSTPDSVLTGSIPMSLDFTRVIGSLGSSVDPSRDWGESSSGVTDIFTDDECGWEESELDTLAAIGQSHLRAEGRGPPRDSRQRCDSS